MTSRPTGPIAERYRSFADREAAGSSPAFEAWARTVAGDQDILDLLAPLPRDKQQPNLVLAAARVHGARPGDPDSLRDIVIGSWTAVRATILEHATQTNEAARCAALLLGLAQIDGPVALLEVGASAGLCLVPDRYSYTFTDGSRLDPDDGPSTLTIPVTTAAGLRPPARMPDIVWRAGLDLNPLDPGDAEDRAWLEALVWPEHDERRRRLAAAAPIAAAAGVDVRRGDLLHDLAPLAAEAPASATLVVTHSATLAYLAPELRQQAVDTIAQTRARRVSFEARGVDPAVAEVSSPITPETSFAAALDGTPYALADGHCRRMAPVPVG